MPQSSYEQQNRLVMLNKCRPFLTRTLSRVMVEERQKGGDALDGQQTVVTSNGRLISSHCQTAVSPLMAG